MMTRLTLALALLAAAPAAIRCQTPPAHQRHVPYEVASVPFGPGEELRYKVSARWGILTGGGAASLAVEAVDTIHGHPAYRLAFRIEGGLTFLKIDDVQQSWLDAKHLFSRRFAQQLDQTFYERDRTLDFFPEKMRWERLGNPAQNGPLASPTPLDDVSFIYFARSMRLEVGESRTLRRYFKEDGNPVTVRVLRKETVEVPYGQFSTIVIQPIIRTDGLFSEGGEARIWVTDDHRRLPVKIEATARGGVSLKIELEGYTPGTRLVSESKPSG